MAESFDPYHAWLGIGPDDQPPHQYRLLGIQPFESDSHVIANAAQRQMTRVKSFQAGEHAELAQRILKEIAAARNRLLALKKKAEYDRQLRAELEQEAATSKRATQAGGIPGKTEPKNSRSVKAGRSKAQSLLRRSRESDAKARSKLFQIVLGGIAGTVIALAIVYLIRGGAVSTAARPVPSAAQEGNSRYDPPPTFKFSVAQERPAEKLTSNMEEEVVSLAAKPVPPAAREDKSRHDPPPASQPSVAQERPAKKLTSNTEEEVTTPPAEPDNPPISENPEPSASDLRVRSDANGSGAGDSAEGQTRDSGSGQVAKPEPQQPQPGVSTQTKKPGVPSDAEQKTAERRIREVFRIEFAAAKKPEQQRALAEKLLKLGLETSDKPAIRFVLLELAREHAVEAADLGVALKAIDGIGATHAVDLLAMKADALAKVVVASRTVGQAPADVEKTLHTAMSLIDEAVIIDNYPVAKRLAVLTASLARRAKDVPLVRELTVRKREIQSLQQEFAAFQEARAVLAGNPTDREANLTAGQWYCFKKNDWDRGLHFLAKGADQVLADLAERDIAGPSSPEERVQLGDAWWDLFEKEKRAEKWQFQQRALYWYELALPELSGLSKATIEKKYEEALAASAEASGPHILGVVQKGNVALAGNEAKISARGEKVEYLSRVLGGTNSGYAWAKHPCEWTIVLPGIYRLQEIRFELLRWKGYFYRYTVATSPNGREYSLLLDRSRGKWSGQQQIRFYPRSVKAIKVMGLYASPSSNVCLGQFEAYCIPPQPLPE